MRKSIIFIFCVLINFGTFGQSVIDLSKAVPTDKSIRKGVLPNGLTYYIKYNPHPKGKASFYLYQNVGAVLETDKQNGLAHFLEHMAFNGSTHFPGNSVIDMMERKGVKFGKEINAYTSTNETVYNLSQVPVTNEKLIDSCLLILNDWCNALTLTDKEIDAERKVIQEEWRQRYNAQYRLDKQLKGVKYNNSVYSKRDALGSMDVVKNFKYKALRDFYHDWYRTDLQAIAVIGDINVEQVEQNIQALFSKIPAIKKPKERTYVTIPDNNQPLYKVARDKEVKNIGLNLEIRSYYEKDNSQQQLRETFVHAIFNVLINARYKEEKMKGKTPYNSVRIQYGDFEKNYKAFNMTLSASEGEVTEALKAVYTEIQRVAQHGFTQGEIDRLKQRMLETNEARHQAASPLSSDAYGLSIKAEYLDGLGVPDAEFNYNFVKTVVPTITREEVSNLVDFYLTKKNRVFTITAPEKSDLNVPSLKKIESIMTEVENTTLEPYKDEIPVNVSLLESSPEGGDIVNEGLNKAFKAVEWQLSNGAKVVYKYSNNKKGTMELNAISFGGSSVYEVEDIPSYQAVSLVNNFGIGDLDPLTYSKVMANNSAKSKVILDAYQEQVTASAATKDLETMFQLVYMRFENPRFDEEMFNDYMSKNYKRLETPSTNSNALIGDAYKTIVANGNPRYFEYNKDYIDKIDFEKVKEIYNDRFSNASDFTFYLIGDAPFETVKNLVKTYIGAIQSGDRKESIIPQKNYFPKGFNKHRIEIPMEAPRATVVIKLQEDIEYNRARIVYHTILGDILNIRCIENIREKEGGVYTISVNARDTRIPEARLNMDISFNCDPQNAEHLNDLLFKEIEKLKTEVTQSDLDKVVLNIKKNRPLITKSNQFWMSALEAYYENNENMLAPDYFDAILNKVTTDDIKKVAKDFFGNADTLDFLFVPKA